MRLGRLLGRVGEAREPTVAGQHRDDVEEPLATIERGVSLDLPEGVRLRYTSVMPPAGDLRQVVGCVLNVDDGQAAAASSCSFPPGGTKRK